MVLRKRSGRLSHYRTIEDYIERMSHPIVANDKNMNKDNENGGASGLEKGRAHAKNGQVSSTLSWDLYPAMIQLGRKAGSE